MSELDEKLKRLSGKTAIVPTEEVKKRKRGKGMANGGARAGAGGKKPTKLETITRLGIQTYIDDHYYGKTTIRVTDPKTGRTIDVQKTRVVLALEKLWNIGMKGEGNADALNKWLDRALGRAIQPLGGEDPGAPVFNLQVNIKNILDKAYGQQGSREEN